MTWTTRDFLLLVYDFVGLSPDHVEWNFSTLKDNPPRLIRLLRILSLLGAYGIKPNRESTSYINNEGVLILDRAAVIDTDQNHLKEFVEGGFLKKRSSNEFENAFSLIVQLKDADRSKDLNLWDAIQFFSEGMRYRFEVNHSIEFASGFLAASSPGLRTLLRKINNINRELKNQVFEIDEILIQFINPNELEFEQSLLEDEFGFPPDDLEEIDVDFM